MDEDSILSKLINNEDVYGDGIRRPSQTRQEKYKFDRLDIDAHFEMCRRTDGFQRCYHLSEQAFESLLEVLKDSLAVNEAQSWRSTKGNAPIIGRKSDR